MTKSKVTSRLKERGVTTVSTGQCGDGARARQGNGRENDLAESRAAGFRFHLTKPVSFAQLKKHLAEFPSLPDASS